MQKTIQNNGLKTAANTPKGKSFKDLAKNYGNQAQQQFGIPLEVTPLTGIKLPNRTELFVDTTVDEAV